jgi:hypothetical protein
MSISFKPPHLSRYKDIAWLLFKYGRGELVDAAGLDDGGNHNGHAAPKPVSSPEAKELANDLEKTGPVFIKIGQLLSDTTGSAAGVVYGGPGAVAGQGGPIPI